MAGGGINGNTISRDDVSINQYSKKKDSQIDPKVSMKTKLGIDSSIKSDYLNAEDLILLDKLPKTILKPSEEILKEMEEKSYGMISKGINILFNN